MIEYSEKNRLVAEKISVGYNKHKVLSDIDISIPTGKVTVFIGENGSGKSTLLKAFCRILEPMEGRVLLDGKSISSYPRKEFAKIVGLLSQFSSAPEGIRVTDLVSRGRYPYKKTFGGLSSEDFEAIKSAMEKMQVMDIADVPVDELSGGQKQRVWLAMAIAQETDILFLDEPTTFLDIAYQIEILNSLKRLNEEHGKTIVMVLHDLNMSSRYADHIVAIKDGHIIAEGDPDTIITPSIVRNVYGLECEVMEDPVSRKPMILPK